MSIIETLVDKFPIRRSKAQKEAFRAWFVQTAQEMGYAAQVETVKEHHNVVIGDPETAQAIFVAHYDTPAASFMPNLMTPRNIPFFFFYQILLVCVLVLAAVAVGVPVGLLTGDEQVGYLVGYALYMGLLFMMLFGPANKHNVNDNTSGVAAILETMARIPEADRSKAAFILFDNEEKGCIGSKVYAKAHPAVKQSGFIVNLDCVGDGEHILLLGGKQARGAAQYAALVDGMTAQQGRELHVFPLEKSVYNSDQKNFKVSSAVCACKQRKGLGFYCDKIHTGRDTVCEQANLDFLADGLAAFIVHL